MSERERAKLPDIWNRLMHVKLAKSCMGLRLLIDDAAAEIARLRAAARKSVADRPEQPVAFADDAAMSGGVGNVASRAAKEYWEGSHAADRMQAERLKHPLYAAPVARPEPAQPTNAEIDWAQQYHGAAPITAAQYVAPQEPAQPVAYMWQHGETGRTQFVHAADIKEFRMVVTRAWHEVGPLYAAPPSHPAPSEAGAERQWANCSACKGSGSVDIWVRETGFADQGSMETICCDKCGGTGAQPAKGDASS